MKEGKGAMKTSNLAALRALSIGTISLTLSYGTLASAAVEYHVTGFSTATNYLDPYGLNAHGAFVGMRCPNTQCTGSKAFIDGAQGLQLIGTLGGTQAQAAAINDSGVVVGFSNLAGDAFTHAFKYENGSMADLGTLGGNYSQAVGINSNGDIIGNSTLGGDVSEHAILIHNGVMQDLGTFGGTDSAAFGINDAGDVVGGYFLSDGSQHAFLYRNGIATDLGGDTPVAAAINASGVITGNNIFTPGGNLHAFADYGAGLVDIGTLAGVESHGMAINSAGIIVGGSNLANGQGRAFLYDGHTMRNLNDLIDPNLGWTLFEARGINDDGQVLVWARNRFTRFAGAVLLTPVPEPGTWALMLIGFGGLGAALRRRATFAAAQWAS